MVVPVLITSCQVSENPNAGPVTAQIIMMNTATLKAMAEPAINETLAEILRNIFFICLDVVLALLYNRYQQLNENKHGPPFYRNQPAVSY